jgi:O-phospho-L-seryl-tRNASec:L-selenocysteinyl-tRNA synthase
MDAELLEKARALADPAYVTVAEAARRSRTALFRQLLTQRRLLPQGLDEHTVRLLVDELAGLDANQFIDQANVGEREGRIYSELVRARHFGMAHGMGRAGDLAASQPKACGASILVRLCAALLLDALHVAGFRSCRRVALLPIATGMAMTLCLLALRWQRPAADRVLWIRIDQKACLKCISAAGYQIDVLENKLDGDQVVTDMEALEKRLAASDHSRYAAVISTTSCFAPRAPDRVVAIAQLCARYGIPHLINHAYGVQSRRCNGLVCAACRLGRVDAVIFSFDKNFMVPVGGAGVAGTSPTFIEAVESLYPGRASVAPVVDLFITLLQLGRDGFSGLLRERERRFQRFQAQLAPVLAKHGERLLHTPDNPISFAISLEHTMLEGGIEPTAIGSMLYARRCSGPRAVLGTERRLVQGVLLAGYGAHIADYPVPYLNLAAAIGIRDIDIERFCRRLDEVLGQVRGTRHASAASAALGPRADPGPP